MASSDDSADRTVAGGQRVWIAARFDGRELMATAHVSERGALQYLKHRYAVPSYIALSDVLGWIGANSKDLIKVDFDEF